MPDNQPVGLMHIAEVQLPIELVDEVYDQLIETGKDGYERLALFAGDERDNSVLVTNVLFPQQYLRKGPFGVSFHVDSEELDRIWDWLFENNKTLISQVHSHPTDAYHSEADDQMAIITTFGGFSIVVPDFGTSDNHFSNSAIYRLQPDTGWTQLSETELSSTIKLVK